MESPVRTGKHHKLPLLLPRRGRTELERRVEDALRQLGLELHVLRLGRELQFGGKSAFWDEKGRTSVRRTTLDCASSDSPIDAFMTSRIASACSVVNPAPEQKDQPNDEYRTNF